MSNYQILPNVLIFDFGKQIQMLQRNINNILPGFDLEALLSIIFSCFIDNNYNEDNVANTINWLISDGFEYKENLSDIQKYFIVNLLKEVMQDIYDEILEHGFLNGESFPYQFNRLLLPAGSVVLTKIGYTLPRI